MDGIPEHRLRFLARVIEYLVGAFPQDRYKVDENTVKAWAVTLERYSDERIMEAARNWAEHGDGFPSCPQMIDELRGGKPDQGAPYHRLFETNWGDGPLPEPDGTLMETAEEIGSEHLLYYLRGDGRSDTGVRGVNWLFPPKGPECACPECSAKDWTAEEVPF